MARILQVVERNRAGKWSRFFNYLIDYAFALLLIIVLIFIYGMVKYFFLGSDLTETANELDTTNSLVDQIIYTVLYAFIMFLIEKFSNGKSLGKLITGTKVVKTDGSALTTDDLLKRNFSRIVPFDGISFLGNNGWHDSWSDTRVVNAKEYDNAINTKNEIDTIGIKENF